jgi:hypothetical protein
MEGFESPPTTPVRKAIRLWQAHNRRHWELEKDVLAPDDRAPFVCECTSGDCLEPVALTMHEYEAGHMCPNWCVVRPAHTLPDDGGRVIMREPHFWVVELAALPAATPSRASVAG